MDDQRTPPPGSALAQPGGGPVGEQVTLPSGGVFAQSEVMRTIREARNEMWQRKEAWLELRTAKDHAKAKAKKTRADLMVRLRVFGNDATDGVPMKTAVERNEWADADADVQRAELEADLAQTVAMASYEAYQDAQALFATLQTVLGIERDDIRSTRAGQ
jgi:hypothetical protein